MYMLLYSGVLPLLGTNPNYTWNVVLFHCKRLRQYHKRKKLIYELCDACVRQSLLLLHKLPYWERHVHIHVYWLYSLICSSHAGVIFNPEVSVLSNLLQLANWEQLVCLEDAVCCLVVLLGRKLCSTDNAVLFCCLLVSMWSILLLGKSYT